MILTKGWRKTAVARCRVKEGKGVVRINGMLLDALPWFIRMRIEEPLILAGEIAKKLDFKVNVYGGGVMAQADAARTAIARGIIEYLKQKDEEKAMELRKKFIQYDRTLLVPDTRMTEPQKPYRSAARRMRQTSKR